MVRTRPVSEIYTSTFMLERARSEITLREGQRIACIKDVADTIVSGENHIAALAIKAKSR